MEAVKAIGWVVAAIAVIAAVMLGMQAGKLQKQVAVLEVEVASMQAETARTRGQLESLMSSSAAAAPQAPEAAAPETAPDASAAPAPESAAPSVSAPDDPAATPTPPAPEASPNADADEAQGEQSFENRVARGQVAVLTDMAYRGFYEAAGLTGERLSEVQAILSDGFSEDARIRAQAMAAGTAPAKEITAKHAEAKARLRERLAGVLSADELAAYDAHEAVADQSMYTTMLDGQLAMLAPTLSEENRKLASQVIAEELVLRFDEFGASDQLFTLDNFNAAQMVALENALSRVQDTFEPDQYNALAGFIDTAGTALGAQKE